MILKKKPYPRFGLFSLLKGQYHLVTTKARSLEGYLAGIYATLCAYQLCHKNKANDQN